MTTHDWVVIGYWCCVAITAIILIGLLWVDDISRPGD